MEKNRILREKIEDSFAKAKKAISDFAGSVQFPLNDSSLEHIIAALVKTTLAPERLLSSTDVENFRMVWSRNFSPEDVDKIVANLYESTVSPLKRQQKPSLLFTMNIRKKSSIICLNSCPAVMLRIMPKNF